MHTAPTEEIDKIPADLNTIMSTHQLLCRAYEAVDAVGWSGRATTQGKVLLTLLAYAYSAGIYGAVEIESALPLDPAMRYIARGHVLSADEIRAFRRRYSAEVEATLGSLYGSVIKEPTQAANEARERLRLAVRTDSAWMDI